MNTSRLDSEREFGRDGVVADGVDDRDGDEDATLPTGDDTPGPLSRS
jgi:hypothetical protein